MQYNNEFLDKIKQLLSEFGQVSYDRVTAQFKPVPSIKHNPDLVFLNNNTDKGVVIEYNRNYPNYSMPIGVLTTVIAYKQQIENLNINFSFILIFENNLSPDTNKILKDLSIPYYTLDEYGVNYIVKEILRITESNNKETMQSVI